jgi:hypothetical protein
MIKGMRKRPWPLVLLALLQILTPVFTILFHAWAMKVSPVTVLAWVFDRSWLEIFETILLMPIAGVAVFLMKRWSYAVFLLAIGWSATRNFMQWNSASSVISSPALIVVYVAQIALVAYFLLPAVRTTFFDPTVRWWEQKPRYLLELAVRVWVRGDEGSSGQQIEGTIRNLSEGGAFVALAQKLQRGSEIRLMFSVIGLSYDVEGTVVHSRELEQGQACYGIQFDHTPETLDAFKRLAGALGLLGFTARKAEATGWEDFAGWLGRLLRTGRGLLPEIPGRANRNCRPGEPPPQS